MMANFQHSSGVFSGASEGSVNFLIANTISGSGSNSAGTNTTQMGNPRAISNAMEANSNAMKYSAAIPIPSMMGRAEVRRAPNHPAKVNPVNQAHNSAPKKSGPYTALIVLSAQRSGVASIPQCTGNLAGMPSQCWPSTMAANARMTNGPMMSHMNLGSLSGMALNSMERSPFCLVANGAISRLAL